MPATMMVHTRLVRIRAICTFRVVPAIRTWVALSCRPWVDRLDQRGLFDRGNRRSCPSPIRFSRRRRYVRLLRTTADQDLFSPRARTRRNTASVCMVARRRCAVAPVLGTEQRDQCCFSAMIALIQPSPRARHCPANGVECRYGIRRRVTHPCLSR